MGDANWFFSTCAQTAGAVVAIVGGFIATRLISMGASKEGVRQSLTTAQRNLEHAMERADSATQELRDLETAEFRSSVLARIVEADARWTPETLLQAYRGNYLDEDALRAAMASIAEAADRASSMFEEIDDDRIADMEFEEAAVDLAAPPSLEERDVFEEVFSTLRGRARSRLQERGRGHGFLGLHPEWVLDLSRPAMDDIIARGSVRAAMHERLVAAKSEVDRVEAAVEGLRAEAARVQPVKGLTASLGILAYLCAVGVAWPLALLPVAEDS
jgi:hypothetical protein